MVLAAGSLMMAQPKPKSQKEVEAIMAMQGATDADSRIKAANELITKFADTQFKPMALYMIASSYREKNDHTNTIVYSERAIDAEPKSAFAGHARIMIAASLGATTKEFDFDKEEKLGRGENLAKEALEVLQAAPKFNPGIPDDQWDLIKKDYLAEGYAALGILASVRKNWDAAITNFKTSVETTPNPDPVVMVRLTSAYNNAGKFDDAIALADKVAAIPNLPAQIAQFVKMEKDKAVKAKGSK
jgi:lipopolysaccharide biosynthesis regulator YciM